MPGSGESSLCSASGRFKEYHFLPKKVLLLTQAVAEKIIEANARGDKSVYITLDLGRSISKVFLREGRVELEGISLPMKELERIKEKDIYQVGSEGIKKVAFFAGGNYYRLVNVYQNCAPTLEINGIHMHRIKNITPWDDASEKVKLAKIFPGAKVLDICTGLGYTAILSLKRGASVVTVEKDENVLRMAEINPWSKELESPKVKMILGDATEVIHEFEKSSFDRIIHDPPRLAMAGELYSGDFYSSLFEVLKPGGTLFHYTGEPGKMRRKDVPRGVCERLKASGFEILRKTATGVVARKP
ncbi:MAG: methyltransferase domain-containing protein [Candidatus Hadarchaeales archaeon]